MHLRHGIITQRLGNGYGTLAGVGNGFYLGNSTFNVKNIARNNVFKVGNSNWQVIYGSNVIQSNNSWNGDVTASIADFISIETLLERPEQDKQMDRVTLFPIS